MFRVSYLTLTFAGLSPEARDGIIAAAVMGSLAVMVATLAVVIVGVVYCRYRSNEGAYTYMYRQTETFTCSCFLYLCLL